MRSGLLILLLVAVAASCGGGSPPSVLLVTVDTLRADAVGIYGGAGARTPRMDRLAAAGVRFTQARANCPLTLPSHTTILTGLLPPEHAFRDNDPPHPLPPPAVRSFSTLAEVLRGEGYSTAAFVSASVLSARTGLDQGFDVYDGPPEGVPGALRFSERVGGETVDRAVAWLEDAGGPFFLWVHLFDPHDPYFAPVAFRTPGARAGSRQAYADEVAYADSCVGRLLDALAGRGDADRTLAIVTADHGEGLGEHGEPTHGYLLYDTTLRVPLIMRWPGRIEAGTVREDGVSLRDLFDTVLAAAAPDRGTPSLLDGPTGRPSVAETLYGWRHMGWAQLLAACEGNRKLIRGVGDEVYDPIADPGELRPLDGEADSIGGPLEALDAYRLLGPKLGGSKAPMDPVAGLPYLSGTGRGRTKLLPGDENRELRAPDPALAAEIDAAKSQVGRGDPAAVSARLAELSARDPGNPTIPFWMGRNALAADDPAAAAPHFATAFELGLRDAKVVDLWLKALLLAGRLDDTGRVIEERVPEIVPDCGTYLLMGAYFQSKGDRAKAARMADAAERLARTNSDRELLSRFRHKLGSGNEK